MSNNTNGLDIPIGFRRLNSFPLDSSSVFQTLSGLQNYALNNKTAYSGQVCSVIENDNAYIIKGDGSIKEIGFISPSLFENLVYTTGNQSVSGLKTFEEGLQVGRGLSTSTLFIESGFVGINNENPQGALDVSGSVLFNQRPTVNGSNVLIKGEGIDEKFSLSLSTGISKLDIFFPTPFSIIPSIFCNIDGENNVIYQTLIKNKTVSGCSIFFSDTIQEENCYLNIFVSDNRF
jgi:hypothetical protein